MVWVLSAKRQGYCALAVGVAAQYREKARPCTKNPPWVNRARTAFPQPIKTAVLLSHQLTRWSTS
jgi:hypothetical protein